MLTFRVASTRRVAKDNTGVLAQDHPGVTLLVNNAGVALGGRFDQVTLEEFDWVMDVNFRAAVRLVRWLALPSRLTGPQLLPAVERHRDADAWVDDVGELKGRRRGFGR